LILLLRRAILVIASRSRHCEGRVPPNDRRIGCKRLARRAL